MFSPIIRQIDLANALTLTGLMLSFISVIFSMQSNFYAAIICMMYAGIIDLFDGFLARRTERTELQSEVGKHLDSLVDICSFGFAPAIFAYSWGLREPFSIALLVIYMAMNALRLAYFNSTGLTISENKEYYTGLPVTYAALFIPLTFTLSFFIPNYAMKIVLQGLYLLLATAMISGFKMLKLSGVWYGIFSLAAIGLTGVYIWKIIITN